MGLISPLSKEQKQSIFLLQTGTFLEHFDLLLYVHMAVFLNALFFPEASGFSASLLSAFAFCSTFVFRPFGAMIFGYIGDQVGRAQTVVVTSLLMSFSCIVMMFAPTYQTAGMMAAVIVTVCRAVQGMSSMGEIVGAGIYLTETTPRPARYSAIAWLYASASLGEMAALGVAALVTSFNCQWRPVFGIGATIALVGSVARTKLRETPEFLKNKRTPGKVSHSKPNYKTLLAMFFIFSAAPMWVYSVFIYFPGVLRDSFGYTPQDIIQNNLLISIWFTLFGIFCCKLVYHIYPLKLVKFFIWGSAGLVIACPYVLEYATSAWQITTLQILLGTFELGSFPGVGVFYRHIPSMKRMTFVSMSYALAKAFMYIIVSFGMVYLNLWFGHQGIWVIMLPIFIAFTWALKHFEKLDQPYKDTADDPHAGSQQETQAPPLARAA